MTATKKSPSLLFCILMDIIGCLSFTIPGVGEFADVIWAPVSAIILAKTFGGTRGMFGGVFNFMEEILPGTDIIPTFTIMWLLTNKMPFFNKKSGVIPVKAR
ncbi:hypothetical protein LQ567_19680 [Niabella pedocola]|uniref:Uncharacterized protein n=1 Tax=Niabella pedocola TaxID=1752077 RepID=A0ABS8PVC7_9BACT|nr:hypothetical protein [Niabella pedocola]MCD2425015.1 hypothetical protein [Niabella pedocola]